MRWGTPWGWWQRVKDDIRTKVQTLWGSDGTSGRGSRVTVVLKRGRIVPCDTCGTLPICAMYKSFTRNRLRSGYTRGTNILHYCDIYTPKKSP